MSIIQVFEYTCDQCGGSDQALVGEIALGWLQLVENGGAETHYCSYSCLARSAMECVMSPPAKSAAGAPQHADHVH